MQRKGWRGLLNALMPIIIILIFWAVAYIGSYL